MELPDLIQEDADEHVISYWLGNDDTALQLSALRRTKGDQVAARQRLDARLKAEALRDVQIDKLALHAPDAVSALGVAQDGLSWLYAYLVWPDLTIFVTISKATREWDRDSWAVKALMSLRRKPAAVEASPD